MIPMQDLSVQYEMLKDELDPAIRSVISSSRFIGGEQVKDFEKSFADYLHVEHCISVGSGSDALEIAIEALEFPEGSEVILPVNTFIAAAEAVSRAGLTPVFCDSGEDHNIDVEAIERLITDNTKAIMAVHLYGLPCDMEELTDIAERHGLKVIEDCAHAHGAEYRTRKAGGLGDIAAFSFNPGKNIGAFGDAGAITTNDERLARRCRAIADHGRESKNLHTLKGRNSRLDAIQAAVLNIKIKHIHELLNPRINNAKIYLESLKDIQEISLPTIHPEKEHAFHQFVITTNKRDELKEYLSERGIETAIHYPTIIARQPAFADTKNYRAEKSSQEILSLPIAAHLKSEDISIISKAIRDFFHQQSS